MNRGVFEGSFKGCSAANSAQSSWVSRRSGRPEDRVPAGATVSQNQCSRWRRSSILARKVQSFMKIIPASDSSLLIVFGNVISLALHKRVMALFHAFQARHDPRIRNLHPGYASLLIDFDPLQLTHEELTATVQQLEGTGDVTAGENGNAVTIPVCYDIEFGLDLADVAHHAGIPPEEVVRIHSSPTYHVYFLGFSPGFVYLGGLPEILHTPRLATPRTSIAGGSVGIAGSQTGIYPVDSPGGWKLIGRTPLRMFDPAATPPTRLQPGDRMKFAPIDRATFEDMSPHRQTRVP
jgi:inhibitor of KinA